MNLLTRGLLFVAISLFTSCSGFDSKKERETIALATFIKLYPLQLDSLKSILVLTEKGCPNCNRSFALFAEKFISKKNSAMIISASGNIVDVSPFTSSEDTYFDFDFQFQKTNLSGESCTIFLVEGQVDTIVKIKAQGIEETLNYISKRLNLESIN